MSSARRLGVLCLAILVLLPACDGSAGGAAEVVRADSAGVSIVLNRGPDRMAPLVFHEDFRLGGRDDDAHQAFYHVNAGNVAVDGRGWIHVLDSSAFRVVVFDERGIFVRAVGRPGEGPGELSMPMGLVVSSAGEIGVVDLGRFVIVRFAPDGEVRPPDPFPANFFGGPLYSEGDASVAVFGLPQEAGGDRLDVLVRATATDTTRIATLAPVETRAVSLTSCGMQFSGMPPLFSPTLRWAAAGDLVAAVTGAAYDIMLVRGDGEQLRIRREVSPEPATDALALAELGDGMEVRTPNGVVTCNPREVVEQRGIASHVPAIRRLALSPRGELWVQRGGPQSQVQAIDLFDADGTYRGTLPAGSPFPIAFFPDGRIAAADEGALGVQRLVVYRVEGAE